MFLQNAVRNFGFQFRVTKFLVVLTEVGLLLTPFGRYSAFTFLDEFDLAALPQPVKPVRETVCFVVDVEKVSARRRVLEEVCVVFRGFVTQAVGLRHEIDEGEEVGIEIFSMRLPTRLIRNVKGQKADIRLK